MIQTSTRGERQRVKYNRRYNKKGVSTHKEVFLKTTSKSLNGVTYTHYKKAIVAI